MNEFMIDDSTNMLTKYTPFMAEGAVEQLFIPCFLRGKNVDSIAPYCFKDTEIKSLTVGNGVKRLEQNAFADSACYDVKLPCGMEISRACFAGSKLHEIMLPNDLTVLKTDTFLRCRNLESIDGTSCIKTISSRAFAYCEKIKKLQFTNLKSIGDSVFMGCSGLQSLTLGNGIQHLGKFLFYSCESLNDVTLIGSFSELEFETFLGARGIKRLTISTTADSLNIPPHCFDETSLEEITFLGDFEPIINVKSCLPKNILIKAAAGSPAMDLAHYFPVEAF